jgi:ribose-phosphate pyrophosphokinase
VTVIFPYYGYSTFDKKENQKIPIAAADVSKILEIAGVDKVACIDLHAGQIEGFFSIPADNIASYLIMVEYLINSNLIQKYNKVSIVSIDADNVYRTKKFAEILMSKTLANITLSLVINENLLGFTDTSTMHLVGQVEGKECIIVGDIIDSAQTIISAADVLFNNGAKKVYVFATHGVFSGTAIEDLNKSKITKVIVTNTIPIPNEKLGDKFIVLSAGTLIAEIIRRLYYNESISEISLI